MITAARQRGGVFCVECYVLSREHPCDSSSISERLPRLRDYLFVPGGISMDNEARTRGLGYAGVLIIIKLFWGGEEKGFRCAKHPIARDEGVPNGTSE